MSRNVRPIWTLDCETDPFHNCQDLECKKCEIPGKKGRVPQPFVWDLYDGEGEEHHIYRHEQVGEMVAFIAERNLLIYAHNGGKFDYHFLREFINSDDPLMIINGRIGRARIGQSEIRDSINILPVALKSFAKDDIDYSLMESDVRNEPANWELIIRYLRSDCEHLYDFITQYQSKYGKGLTQAGAAMKYWSKTSGLKPPKQSAGVFNDLKPFYYGGRVQAFVSGHQFTPFSVCDINSAYPYAMKFRHPFSTVPIHDDRLPTKGIEQCFIELDCISRGVFPWRSDDGRTYYPDDGKLRRYKVSGWEFVAGLDCDALSEIQIFSTYRFDQTVTFDEYIDYFYKLRLESKTKGDKANDLFAKLLMNSLYGKFGADPSKYKEWVLTHDENRFDWESKGYADASVNWGARKLFTRELSEEKHRYYNVATAASITGFVRALLFRAIQKCEHVYYCDTDSICAATTHALQIGPELGSWKHEFDGDEYAIAGKKLYALRDAKTGEYKTACKGVKLTAQEIIDVSEGRTVCYRPQVPTFSILKEKPEFTGREVKSTYRDMRMPV